jgi:hypothetical protein
MNDQSCYVSEPSAWQTAMWSARRWPSQARAWLAQILIKASVLLIGDTNSLRHARRELQHGLTTTEDGPDRWMAHNILQLLAVFYAQGHSGFSASWAIAQFKKLAAFEPLGPLTGEPHEWVEVGEGMYQNNRCGAVFKDGMDGKAYYLDGRVFREPDGSCYTNKDSRVFVDFPYVPHTEYVDVPASDD